MSGFVKCLLTVVTIGASISTGWAFVQDQAPPDVVGIENIEALIKSAFPSLANRRLEVVVEGHSLFDHDWTDPAELVVTVKDPVAAGQLTLANRDAAPLIARAQLTSGRVRFASFRGGEVQSRKLDEFETVASAHPGWRYADLTAALSERNARYGPSSATEFANQLDLRKFEPAIGKIVRSTVRFSWSEVEPDEKLAELPPSWNVYVATVRGSNEECYALSFEPFGGTLRSLRVLECRELTGLREPRTVK